MSANNAASMCGKSSRQGAGNSAVSVIYRPCKRSWLASGMESEKKLAEKLRYFHRPSIALPQISHTPARCL